MLKILDKQTGGILTHKMLYTLELFVVTFKKRSTLGSDFVFVTVIVL